MNEPTERMCALTRTVRPVDDLIRFVVDPDGAVVADLRRRLPGRGVWLSADRSSVETAERRKLFGRAFKAEVRVEPGLADRVRERLEAAALGALAMARKAGTVVTGFTKAEAAVRAGAIGLLHAVEAADDGARKLDGPFRARAGQAAPVLRIFSADQLGLALGGPHVIHAALLAGRPSEVVLERVAELVRYDCRDGSRGSDGAWPQSQAGHAITETDQAAGQKTE